MSYREFFKSLTDFYPHPYQERVAEHLQGGQSVLIDGGKDHVGLEKRIVFLGANLKAAVAPVSRILTVVFDLSDPVEYTDHAFADSGVEAGR